MHYITQLTEAVNISCNLFLFYNKWQPKVSLPTAVRRYVIVNVIRVLQSRHRPQRVYRHLKFHVQILNVSFLATKETVFFS